MDTLHTLFYFLVAVGVLVAFHEFGHFWVARKTGVKVLRFSIGFGKVLWSYQKSPNDVEYVLSAIPLGGYVKMVDEREGDVSAEDLPVAFNRQALWKRTAIVAAGPLFNLLLAVALFWLVLVIGEMGLKPIVGPVAAGSLAGTAGFVEGDEIIAVNGEPAPTWVEAISRIITQAQDGGQAIDVDVKSAGGQMETRVLQINEADLKTPDHLYDRLGFKPWSPRLKPVVDKVMPDSAALAAGLKKGDLIVSADGKPIDDWLQWVDYVKIHPARAIQVQVDRAGSPLSLTIIPKAVQVGKNTEGKIGASNYVPEGVIESMTVKYSLSPWAAMPKAFAITYAYSLTTLKMMGKMLIGKASVENLSGPLSIAQYAGQSASMGLVHFLKFLGIISVSLGVLNLMPIPVLDGGHLLFFLLEGVKGSPVPEKIQIAFQQIGIALLVSLMALAMFLDLQRMFP